MPLIDSERLSEADRAAWRAARQHDELRARTPRIGDLHERAARTVERFLCGGGGWCAVSWGKDSVATAAIAAMMSPRVHMVHVRMERAENPESARVRDAFLGMYPKVRYDEVVVPWPGMQGEAIAWEAIGIATHQDFFFDALSQFGKRRISGIRASESSVRAKSALRHGLATDNSCRPILQWSENDVFAFLAALDLPVHPVYAMTMGGLFERDRLRVDIIGDDPGEMSGRRSWEQRYFPDVLEAMRA